MTELVKGTVIGGKYRLERMIGKGGMGSVWAARHAQLDMPVAVKFMDPLADTPESRVRFEREARAAAGLRSPHVVQILDHGLDDGVPFIAMELLEGEDLGERLRKTKRIPLQQASKILTQAAKALKRAHDAGVIHRDLKPSNIFLARFDEDEVVKLLDFGVAKLQNMHGELDPNDNATKTGIVFGSPSYMSPEQARGVRVLDHKTDLWSLAVILFRAITGDKPFQGDSIGDLVIKLCIDPLPIATEFARDLPPSVDGFFERAFARDPAQRFPNAPAMAAAFEAVVAATGAKLLDETSTAGGASHGLGAAAQAHAIGTPGSGSLLAPISLTPSPPLPPGPVSRPSGSGPSGAVFAPRPPENGPLAAEAAADAPTTMARAPGSGPHAASGAHPFGAASGPHAASGAHAFGAPSGPHAMSGAQRVPAFDAPSGAHGTPGATAPWAPPADGGFSPRGTAVMTRRPGDPTGPNALPDGSFNPTQSASTSQSGAFAAVPLSAPATTMDFTEARRLASVDPIRAIQAAGNVLMADARGRRIVALTGVGSVAMLALVIVLFTARGGAPTPAAAAPDATPITAPAVAAPAPTSAPASPPTATAAAADAPSAAPTAAPTAAPSAAPSASAATAPTAEPAADDEPSEAASAAPKWTPKGQKPGHAPAPAKKKPHPNFGY